MVYLGATLVYYPCSDAAAAHPVRHHETCRTCSNNEYVDMVIDVSNRAHAGFLVFQKLAKYSDLRSVERFLSKLLYYSVDCVMDQQHGIILGKHWVSQLIS